MTLAHDNPEIGGEHRTETVDMVPIQMRAMDETTSLLRLAIEKGATVDTMERLLAMANSMRASRAKEQYDKAMADFQAECPEISKTKEVKTNNGTVAYRYAPIESIVEQVKPLLQKHGFSYATTMEFKGETVRVVCRVKHAGGHCEESPMEVPLGTKTQIMSATQVVAAAATYAKRYAFLNAFGIMTGDEDNDAAPHPTPPTPTKKETHKPPAPAHKFGDKRETTAKVTAVNEIENPRTPDKRAWELVTDAGKYILAGADVPRHEVCKQIAATAQTYVERTVILHEEMGKQSWLVVGISEPPDKKF